MKLGIVGISGLVGHNILKSLDMQNIKFDELILFGNSTIGQIIEFRDVLYTVQNFDSSFLNYLDYCILAVDNEIAKQIVEHQIENKCKCVIIDNSSQYRLSHPLIIPEINPDDMSEFDHIVANPNCSTTMLCMLLKPLTFIGNLKKVFVSTYQASSGAGINGMNELLQQTYEYSFNGNNDLTTTFWKKPYVFNVFSHNSNINKDTHLNTEETKMILETRKILHEPNLIVVPTCIRVPTLRCHCLSVSVEFDRQLEMNEIMRTLDNFKGIEIMNDEDNNQFPEPVIVSGKSDVYVGRIRPNHQIDFIDKTTWSFFVVGDQLLKGASYNSIQILDYLMKIR